MTPAFTESIVEQAALDWLKAVGWTTINGALIAPGEPRAERQDFGEVVLAGRLRAALERLNPDLPSEAIEQAFRKLMHPEGADRCRSGAVVLNVRAHLARAREAHPAPSWLSAGQAGEGDRDRTRTG